MTAQKQKILCLRLLLPAIFGINTQIVALDLHQKIIRNADIELRTVESNATTISTNTFKTINLKRNYLSKRKRIFAM